MLIGSFEEKDLFMNSVLTSIFGAEVYLEENDHLYSLWIKNYSQLDGDRHYETPRLVRSGALKECLDTAGRYCVISEGSISQLDQDL